MKFGGLLVGLICALFSTVSFADTTYVVNNSQFEIQMHSPWTLSFGPHAITNNNPIPKGAPPRNTKPVVIATQKQQYAYTGSYDVFDAHGSRISTCTFNVGGYPHHHEKAFADGSCSGDKVHYDIQLKHSYWSWFWNDYTDIYLYVIAAH